MSKAYHPPAKGTRRAGPARAAATAPALTALIPAIETVIVSLVNPEAAPPAIQTFHTRLRALFSAIGQDAIAYALHEGHRRGAFPTEAAAARFAVDCLTLWETALQAGYAAGERAADEGEPPAP